MHGHHSFSAARIDRRRLLQTAGAGALLSAAGTPLRAQEPKRGGTFRIGVAHG